MKMIVKTGEKNIANIEATKMLQDQQNVHRLNPAIRSCRHGTRRSGASHPSMPRGIG